MKRHVLAALILALTAGSVVACAGGAPGDHYVESLTGELGAIDPQTGALILPSGRVVERSSIQRFDSLDDVPMQVPEAFRQHVAHLRGEPIYATQTGAMSSGLQMKQPSGTMITTGETHDDDGEDGVDAGTIATEECWTEWEITADQSLWCTGCCTEYTCFETCSDSSISSSKTRGEPSR